MTKNGKPTTFITREQVSSTTQVKVWARAAGRCTLCARSVLDSRSFFHTVLTGQMAHNVGATATHGSPRSSSNLSLKERSLERNLLLLCPDCHRMIDDKVTEGLYTRELLEAKKSEHELRVAKATNFEVLRRTMVVTTRSRIRGTNTAISEREVAEAMVDAGLVVHVNDGRPVHIVIKFDDDEQDPWVWDRGMKQIRDAIQELKHTGEEGRVDHVSLFPLAPIPLLVYLGSRLDDKLSVSLFDRHRGGQRNAWCWPKPTGTSPTFQVLKQSSPGSETEVVAAVSVSGSISHGDLPEDLGSLPLVTLSPVTGRPAPGLIGSEDTLDEFSQAWRLLLAEVEAQWPLATRLHVIAAVPASAAIRMGQHRMRDVQPGFVVYQRTDTGTYSATPEIRD